ncbi:MAG: phosphotransferase [Campylobacterota bacterium]|nr:phosphotransferase [Campylobacterota bacterium]
MDRLKTWIATTPYRDYEFSIASADASFRSYYRLIKDDKSFIVMDSSLELESLSPFLNVTHRLLNAKVKAPYIYEQNTTDGYLIIEDFGARQLLDVLEKSNFKKHYHGAMNEIIKMQKADVKELPLYDKEFLHFEMDLMQEWYLEKKLNTVLSLEQNKMIENTLNAISNIVLEQPQDVFVHRDFHSRNIMLTPKEEIGVIDYQDAMNGAITYDLVSLLKDCYVEFEREDIEELALAFRDKKALLVDDDLFLKWFDFMGLQRHIKVLGIFSRLDLRDGKDGYLKDIPLVLKYTIETASRYDETKELALFLKSVTS